MEPQASELLHLVLRWVHLIAGIMWIGNSMLFNWLDRNLVKPTDEGAKSGLLGTIWMVHSGGFYEVKKLMLPPGALPEPLHWFKWQNGVTWLSGMSLLVLLFYMGGASLMTDPSVSSVSPGAAVGLSVATLVGTWLAYHYVWRSGLGRSDPTLATAYTVALIVGASAIFFHYLSGRAAYVHVGVLVGTLMTGNVWFCIVPSQRELIAATVEGREQDKALSDQAKQRSIHNNYFTFPLLFVMLSNHFPSTFGHKHNWAVLTVLALASASIRHLMNIRFGRPTKDWLWGAIGAGSVGLAIVYGMMLHATREQARVRAETVHFAEARGIMQRRCVECHSATPTNATWRIAPNGVMFDTPAQMRQHAQNIKLRVWINRTMPLGNATHMTDRERRELAAWVDQGAKIE